MLSHKKLENDYPFLKKYNFARIKSSMYKCFTKKNYQGTKTESLLTSSSD